MIKKKVTPPPNLQHHRVGTHVETPSRTGVMFARLFSQAIGIEISRLIVKQVTGVAICDQTRILSSKEVRTRHNQKGPDP